MREIEDKKDALGNINQLLAAFIVFILLVTGVKITAYHFHTYYEHTALILLIITSLFVFGLLIYLIKRIINSIRSFWK